MCPNCSSSSTPSSSSSSSACLLRIRLAFVSQSVLDPECAQTSAPPVSLLACGSGWTLSNPQRAMVPSNSPQSCRFGRLSIGLVRAPAVTCLCSSLTTPIVGVRHRTANPVCSRPTSCVFVLALTLLEGSAGSAAGCVSGYVRECKLSLWITCSRRVFC